MNSRKDKLSYAALVIGVILMVAIIIGVWIGTLLAAHNAIIKDIDTAWVAWALAAAVASIVAPIITGIIQCIVGIIGVGALWKQL
jgi:hypothetical protein